jgi:hypothetical protein
MLSERELAEVLAYLPGWAHWPAGSQRLIALEFLGALAAAGFCVMPLVPQEARPAAPSVEQAGTALALGRKR